jgi:DNA-directed RNA polymerase subunit M/transcription elongation factor TFIIS
MTTTFVPRFCNTCNNLLDVYDMTTLSTRCLKCFRTNNISPNNRVISVMTYHSTTRILQPSELLALSNLPTTQRIEKKCEACDFNIMAMTYDKNYNFNYVCIKCKHVYN